MVSRRLLALGTAVAALVVVAGIASQGRPLSTHRGAGPTATFFDYVATTLVIFAIAMLVVVVWGLATERVGGGARTRGRFSLLAQVLFVVAGMGIALLVARSDFANRLHHAVATQAGRARAGHTRSGTPAARRHAHLRWDEIAVVLVLAGGAVVAMLATRTTRRAPRPLRRRRRATVAQSFDDSIDDLRADPDLRRAIVAAYARMERAFASVGLERHPAEAPFEYVSRALASLDTSAGAASRLTSLFEWAKFSQHEPGPEMRDEALAALVTVRDELRGAAVPVHA
ncbi:MAG TPA: DUF4129 domain-containing protein [Gaiellaceae bacterium]|nr:DUF4129 domain-containing protein [Gaiellaceae bacterium]